MGRLLRRLRKGDVTRATRKERSLSTYVPWAEAAIAFGLGFFLYFPLGKTDVGILVWVLGGLQALSRFVYEAHLDREFLPVRKMMEILDLSHDANIKGLRDVVDAYVRISEPEFLAVKDHIVGDARDHLLRLANDKTSDPLPFGEYYTWLLPMVESALPGSIIRAISRMNVIEWTETPAEKKFRELMIAAAARGVEIDRVFMTPRSNLPHARELPAIKAHLKEETPENLRGYFVDPEELSRTDATLHRNLGDGFIAFGIRVALIDIFENGEARGRVTTHPAEISRLVDLHTQLLVHAEELTDALVQSSGSGAQAVSPGTIPSPRPSAVAPEDQSTAMAEISPPPVPAGVPDTASPGPRGAKSA